MSGGRDDVAAWADAVGHASLLSPDDPRRQEVELEVARRGGLAQAQWLALLEESERLRLALVDVEPPEGLVHRLGRASPQVRRGRYGLRWRHWAAAAALLFVAVTAWRFVADRKGAPSALHAVALLAVQDHRATHSWDVRAATPETLERALQPHIPFVVRLPSLGAEFAPVGGRRCTLDSRPVAFTAWRGPGGRVTLLQLRRADFGLDADLPPTRVRPPAPAGRDDPPDVLLFGEGEFVWIVVADSADDLSATERAANARVAR